ncbi:hypothetical protein BC332_10342 [Capsicum chinense]|nr:hypothetical protein BC332_10342 [Capsicum chinense]
MHVLFYKDLWFRCSVPSSMIPEYFTFISTVVDEISRTKSNNGRKSNLSPLASTGYGTHCASTSVGSYVNNVQYSSLNMGIVRGGAPLAWLAIYKKDNKIVSYCSDTDILVGVDDAIKDGVDIISTSIGGGGGVCAEVHEENGLGLGSFHAVSHGIPVVIAAGNSGLDK